MKYVNISNEKNSFLLPTTDDTINLKTVQTYFPDASGLTYTFQNDTRCVNIVNDKFELIHYIDEYKVFYSDSNKVNPTKHDNIIMEIIEKHKSKSSNLLKKKKKTNDVPKTKELIVGWKHRVNVQDSYKLMTEPVGGCKKLNLDLNKEYSFDDVKHLCIQCMKSDDNENFFNNSSIELGNFQNNIFKNFATEDDEACDNFWDFAFNVRTRNGQLRLYLLTTKNVRNNNSQLSPKSGNLLKKSVGTSTTTFIGSKLTTAAMVDSGILSNSSNKVADYKRPTINSSVSSVAETNPKKPKLSLDTDNKCDERHKFMNTVTSTERESVKENINEPVAASSSQLLDCKSNIKIIDKDEIYFSNKLIGQGGYGTVQKAKWCHTLVAVKTIRRGFNEKYIYREIAVMNKIRHPNLISIMAVSMDTTHCYLVMEYFESSNLRNIIFDSNLKKKYTLDEEDKKYVAQQICTAICYLHDPINNIVHEDIKPENILINTDLFVKVCDMGLSKTSDLEACLTSTIGNTYKGTPMYMAPELILREKSASVYSDVWALATVLKELFMEKPIWPVGSLDDLRALILKQSVPDVTDIADLKLKELLLDCFKYVPEERPQCVKLLDHFEQNKEYSSSDSDL